MADHKMQIVVRESALVCARVRMRVRAFALAQMPAGIGMFL